MRMNDYMDLLALLGTLVIGFAFVLGVSWLLGDPDCSGDTNERIPAGCALRASK